MAKKVNIQIMIKEQIEHNLLRNALYHSIQRNFFKKIDILSKFLILIFALLALVIPNISVYLIIVILAGLQLGFNFNKKIYIHQHFSKEYYKLFKEIIAIENPVTEEINKYYRFMIELTSIEPTTLRAIDAKAYNDSLDGLGYYDPKKERLYIPYIHKVLGHFIPFNGYHYEKLSERMCNNESQK